MGKRILRRVGATIVGLGYLHFSYLHFSGTRGAGLKPVLGHWLS